MVCNSSIRVIQAEQQNDRCTAGSERRCKALKAYLIESNPPPSPHKYNMYKVVSKIELQLKRHYLLHNTVTNAPSPSVYLISWNTKDISGSRHHFNYFLVSTENSMK